MFKKITLAIITVVFASAAMAGNFGVVDMDRVVKAVPQVKAMQAAIQKKFLPKQKEIMAMQQKFQKDQEKFKKNQAVMSQPALSTAAQDLQKQAQTLQGAQMTFQRELVSAQNDAMQKFFEEVKLAAAKVAAAKNLDSILPENGLLYSAPGIDYTQQVIDALNK
jgi:Skp family chaperone for outer membrane proteins